MPERTFNRLLSPKEAADLLRVSPRTVLNWIGADAVPYVALPQTGARRREYRIPLYGLLRSLEGNYDLAEHLERIEARGKELGLREGETTVSPSDYEMELPAKSQWRTPSPIDTAAPATASDEARIQKLPARLA